MKGFSLTEVLVALILTTTTLLLLLTQQWQAKQSFNRTYLRAKALFELDNLKERVR
jgi:prepilin-type N-terminal cleavage/methylation domain-containing protein